MHLLVVDTNVLFVFAKNPKLIKLIEGLRKADVKFIVPQFCLDELLNVRQELMKYAGFSEEEFEFFIGETKTFNQFKVFSSGSVKQYSLVLNVLTRTGT